jgi:hypothetical protein
MGSFKNCNCDERFSLKKAQRRIDVLDFWCVIEEENVRLIGRGGSIPKCDIYESMMRSWRKTCHNVKHS